MIDLHCHSTFSDGSDQPDAIVAKAEGLALRALALTDHDTLDGLDGFLDMQKKASVRLVPGIEMSCMFAGRDLHVLGLFVGHRDPMFRDRIKGLKTRRLKRNEQIFTNLRAMGITLGELGGRSGEVLTRGHIATALVMQGHAADRAEAFRRYLDEDAPAYAPFEQLSPATAFGWIREAGGLPAIAHPGRFAKGAFIWDAAMRDFRDWGCLGAEALYPDHSATETAYFLRLCGELGMAPTGGSDYHGSMKPGCELGTGRGSLNVPDEILDGLLDKLKEAGIRGH